MRNKNWVLALIIFTICIISGWAEDEKKPVPPPIIHADDWVKAWETALKICPAATAISMFFVDRAGPRINAEKIFECVEIKAVGELLVIVVKHPDSADESVEIVRARDVVRIEVQKSETGNPTEQKN